MIKTLTLRPNAVGDEENIATATSGPGLHWQDVDDVIPDEDTTMVFTASATYQRDLYNLPAHSVTGIISSITVYARCRSNTITIEQASLKIALKTGGIVDESPEKTLTISYVDYSNTWLINPVTLNAWTWADIDALQIGIALRKPGWEVGQPSICTQVYAVISYTPAIGAICQVAFDSDPLDDPQIWTDISEDMKELHIKRGRKHELDRIEAGTATIVLDNEHGNYWMNNPLSPYSPNVDIGKALNLRVDLGGGVIVDLYTGFIEEWLPAWLADNVIGSEMVVNATDLFKLLARLEIDGAGYPEELSGARVNKILTALGWIGGTDIDAGQENMQATGALDGLVALSHLHDVQESELSIFFIARNGFPTYHDRANRPARIVIATLGDGAGEITYQRPGLALDDELLYNRIKGTRIGGVEQVVSDNASKTKYGGWRVLSQTGLLLTADIGVKIRCTFLLSRLCQTALRLKSVILRPEIDADDWAELIFGFEISDKITFELDIATIDGDYFVEGIDIDMNRDKVWSLELQLSDAEVYNPPPELQEQTIRPDSIVDKSNMKNQDGGTLTFVELSDGLNETYGKKEDPFQNCNVRCGLQNPYASGTIQKITAYWRVMGSPSDLMNLSIMIEGGHHYGFQNYTPSGGLETKSFEWALNPATGLAWTWADLNALNIYMAGIGDIQAYVMDMWVKVNFTPSW